MRSDPAWEADCIGSHLVPLSTGADFVRMTVEAALGQEPQVPAALLQKYAAVRFIMEEKDLELLSRLEKNHPGCIREKVLEGKPGSHQVVDSSTRFGYFIVQTETEQELTDLHLFD